MNLSKRVELRYIIISGAVSVFLASAAKCAVAQNLFPVLFVGQVFGTYANIVLQVTAGIVSDCWFPAVIYKIFD